MRGWTAFLVAASLAFAFPAFADGGLRAELTQRAQAGDVDAQMELYYDLFDDYLASDAPETKAEMDRWLGGAVKAGNAEAEYAMGLSLEPVESSGDKRAAIAWLQKAAAQGHGGAMIELIWLDDAYSSQYHYEGVSGVAALQWMYQDSQRASNPGRIEGDAAESERLSAAGFGEGIAEWRARFHVDLDKARAGEPGGASRVASDYLGGSGVKPDRQQAEHWFQIAADSGELADQIIIADHYFNGDLGNDRRSMARVYYQRAATLLRPQAEAGDASAQLQLGDLYYDGKLDAPDRLAQTVKWYQKAATLGATEAYRRLSQLYLTGTGVPKDAAKAIGWLTRAANNDGKRLQNEDEAGVVALDQWALSTLYYEGKVTAQNDDLAYYWLALAMDNVEGDVSSESIALAEAMDARRETLTQRLSKAQIAKVNARVAAWHKAHSAESEN